MSGGHFNYAYFKVDQFADQLERDLKESWTGDYGHETRMQLLLIVNRAREMAFIMKEVEWLLSGDTGEDTFLTELRAI